MKRIKVAAAATAFLASAALVAGAASATADVTPQTKDVVGAGSDTIQLVLNYVADGANDSAGRFRGGYNASATARLISFDATNPGTGKLLTGDKITLRPGLAPIDRPNGSGKGKDLLHGTTNNTNLNFARSSSANSATETNDGLYMFPFATDGLKLAVAPTGSHAPATLTDADVVNIYKGTYTTWNQIPGNESGSTATILPLVPQDGSGTLSYFKSLLKAANGGTDVTFGANVKNVVNGVTVEEHDPTLITGDPDAIAPFSTAREATTANGKIALVGGFSKTRPVYNVIRSADLNKAWVQDIFGPNGYLCSTNAKALINAAGFPQLKSQSAGGVCGVPVQAEPSNLATS